MSWLDENNDVFQVSGGVMMEAHLPPPLKMSLLILISLEWSESEAKVGRRQQMRKSDVVFREKDPNYRWKNHG